jgi:hypothetical protein
MNWIRRTFNSLLSPAPPINAASQAAARFEVYYVSGFPIIPSYLVIVTPCPGGSPNVIVRESDELGAVIYRGRDYQEVADWLSEDELLRITGRELVGDSEDWWIEVWYEPGNDGAPRRLVIVSPVVSSDFRATSEIHIVTPHERLLYKALDYDAALNWLTEQNLHQVIGRHSIDSGVRTRN